MNNFSPLLVICLFLFVAGCGQDRGMGDLRRFVESAYQDKKPDIEPLPPMRPHETFIYAASDLPDPFEIENLRRKAEAAQALPETSRRKEPLERYPLDSLQMAGTMFRDNSQWVIVKAPDGTTHSAKAGNYMGQKNGLITSVTESKIEIVEQVPAPSGGWQDRMVDISLIQE